MVGSSLATAGLNNRGRPGEKRSFGRCFSPEPMLDFFNASAVTMAQR
jgi:hypothetical protein